MKVLVFGLSSQRGGVESVILNYCTEALDQGICEFDFVVIDEIPVFAQYLTRYNCRFFVVPNRVKSPRGYKEGLERIFEKHHYDCVWYNVCTLSDITLLKIAKSAGVSTAVHAHNSKNMGNVLNGILHNLHKKQLDRYVDSYISCSEEAAQFMFPEGTVRTKKWTLLNNAIPLRPLRYSPTICEEIRKQYGLEDNTIIGHVGRFHPQKNHEKILSVFDAYYYFDPSAILVLIGDGELEEQVKKEVDKRGLSDVVLFMGSVENVPEWLSAFDVFLFPSLYEGLPVSLIEAQANGLPCVVSETISEEAIFSNEVRSMSLAAEDSVWAQEIEELLNTSVKPERENSWKNIERAGFDITHEAPKLVTVLSMQN